MLMQWGSEIQTSLDFKWSKRGWVSNGSDFEWDLKSRSPTVVSTSGFFSVLCSFLHR